MDLEPCKALSTAPTEIRSIPAALQPGGISTLAAFVLLGLLAAILGALLAII